MNKKLHVFISHCTEDRLFASALYQELKRERLAGALVGYGKLGTRPRLGI